MFYKSRTHTQSRYRTVAGDLSHLTGEEGGPAEKDAEIASHAHSRSWAKFGRLPPNLTAAAPTMRASELNMAWARLRARVQVRVSWVRIGVRVRVRDRVRVIARWP